MMYLKERLDPATKGVFVCVYVRLIIETCSLFTLLRSLQKAEIQSEKYSTEHKKILVGKM